MNFILEFFDFCKKDSKAPSESDQALGQDSSPSKTCANTVINGIIVNKEKSKSDISQDRISEEFLSDAQILTTTNILDTPSTTFSKESAKNYLSSDQKTIDSSKIFVNKPDEKADSNVPVHSSSLFATSSSTKTESSIPSIEPIQVNSESTTDLNQSHQNIKCHETITIQKEQPDDILVPPSR